MSTSPADLVLRYYAAINARDWAAYDELFSPNCELAVTGSPTTHGVNAMLALDQGYVAVYPDLRIESLRRHVAGSTVVGIGAILGGRREGSGSHRRPQPAPDGLLADALVLCEEANQHATWAGRR